MIRIRSKGLEPTRTQKLLLKLIQSIRRGLVAEIRVRDGKFDSVFRAENLLEAVRPMTLWTKEEGTMRWLDAELRDGDVFLDIGANIGIYTIAAAHRVGARGKVFAFEPHKLNALSLMRNVALNGFVDRVSVFTCALSDNPAIVPFNYNSISSASSGSQLGHTRIAGKDRDFEPVAREMASAMSIDALIADGAIIPPALIKIDVDGNELPILVGMSKLLSASNRPRAIQVEMNVGMQKPIVDFLAGFDYREADIHHTSGGKKAAAAGRGLETIAYTAIFRCA
jgi:FkbM family methyltransferase